MTVSADTDTEALTTTSTAGTLTGENDVPVYTGTAKFTVSGDLTGKKLKLTPKVTIQGGGDGAATEYFDISIKEGGTDVTTDGDATLTSGTENTYTVSLTPKAANYSDVSGKVINVSIEGELANVGN